MKSILSITFAATICFAASAQARTIVLTDIDCERMASISSDAPRASWAGISYGPGQFTNSTINLTVKQAFLIAYPLDRIPPGQRITRAEWIVPYNLHSPASGVRMHVRRILQPWGAGVCHDYRATRPEKLQWNTPGARGLGQDRTADDTAVAVAKGAGDMTLNVTQDVELWYSGAVKNHGWIITVDDPDCYLYLSSPFWGAPKGWKLRITFEPE